MGNPALGSYNPAAAGAHSWDWSIGWLNSLEVPGARRGHTTPHNVPWGDGGAEGPGDLVTDLGQVMVLWGTQETRPRNESAKLRTHLLTTQKCIKGKGTISPGRVHSFIHSFVHPVAGAYLPWARPCPSVGEGNDELHVQGGEKQSSHVAHQKRI